ncbi:hypothetical protein K488DRAFT_74084 [Vararia minispora EC-137]|uniref:Uncharacterized protein n=1 Tax=Vararia minispora EC-137 TaxID=1314806 RepID=A0ACB8Q9W7_9AGAM|nr:hypothetical protein K488DRAFT_74084 [Vararia minispora EC-137]
MPSNSMQSARLYTDQTGQRLGVLLPGWCLELDHACIVDLATNLASEPGFIQRVQRMSQEDLVFMVAFSIVAMQKWFAVKQLRAYDSRPVSIPVPEHLSLPENFYHLRLVNIRECPLKRIKPTALKASCPFILPPSASRFTDALFNPRPGEASLESMRSDRASQDPGAPSPSLTAIARARSFNPPQCTKHQSADVSLRALVIAMSDKILVNITTKLRSGSTGSLHWRREGERVLFSVEADSSDVEVELDAEGGLHKTTLNLKRKASEELSPVPPPATHSIDRHSQAEREVPRDHRSEPNADAGSTGNHTNSKTNASAGDAIVDDSPTEYSTTHKAIVNLKRGPGLRPHTRMKYLRVNPATLTVPNIQPSFWLQQG